MLQAKGAGSAAEPDQQPEKINNFKNGTSQASKFQKNVTFYSSVYMNHKRLKLPQIAAVTCQPLHY